MTMQSWSPYVRVFRKKKNVTQSLKKKNAKEKTKRKYICKATSYVKTLRGSRQHKHFCQSQPMLKWLVKPSISNPPPIPTTITTSLSPIKKKRELEDV